jgi:hypothetical protein
MTVTREEHEAQWAAGLTTVKVRPRWRCYHAGRVYEAGETLTVPIIQGLEWAAWGSVQMWRQWSKDVAPPSPSSAPSRRKASPDDVL